MSKKFLSYISVFLFLTVNIPTNSAQTFAWAKSASGPGGYGEGMAVATDPGGNAIITGQYACPAIAFGTSTLTNAGTGNIYLAKYDQNGNVLWARSAGGIGGDIANAVCTDGSGNIFITGGFSSPTAVFGTYTLTNSGSGDDIFIAKYDAGGNVLWANSVGGTNIDDGYGISADGTGNVFITGGFSSTLVTFGTTTLTNTGGNDAIFVAKYDPSGNALWAKGTGGLMGEDGLSASTDALGNVFITGYFSSPNITFGTYTVNFTGGVFDVFIAKFDPNGNALWAKGAGSHGFNDGYSVCTDNAGNVFMTGDFSHPGIVFDTQTLTTTGVGSAAFIVKYDSNGNVLWAKSAGGTNNDLGYSVSTFTNGVFVAGSFTSLNLTFGTYTITRPPGSLDPMFIVEYDLNGNEICAKALTSGGDDNCGISADQMGNAYVSGDFVSNPFVVGSNTLTLTGTEDVFLAKFNCQPDVGIKWIDENSGTKIFPNPNNGIFILRSDAPMDSGNEIILYNSVGQVVYRQKISQGENNIITNGLAPGFYFFSLVQDKKPIYSGKIFIE